MPLIGTRRAILAPGVPSWVPPFTKGKRTLSYYEFTTNRGFARRLIQPSSTSDFACSRASVGYDLAATTLFSANQFRRTAAGLLVEGAGTNIALQSQSMAPPWSAGGAITSAPTVTLNSIAAPDGSMNGVKLAFPAFSGAGSSANFSQFVLGLTATSGASYENSIFIKGNVGGEIIYFMSQLGSSPFTFYGTSTCILTSSWKRFQVACTTTNTSLSTLIGYNGGSGIVANQPASTVFTWGADIELGASPTSLIPTTTTSATRAADTVSCTIPAGATQALFTFDDASTQTVSVSPGAYAIPTNLNRSLLASMAVS